MPAEVELLQDGVLSATLRRAEKRNALSLDLLRSLNAGLGRHLRQGDVRAVVLRGSGGYFSAGADLEEMARARAGGEEGRRQLRQAMAEFIYLMTSLRTLARPTLALVQGGASGGGVGLLASCQWVLATQDAVLQLPETRLGLFPFIISPVLLRRMELGAFLRLTLEDRPASAEEAREMGLVDEVVSELPSPESAARRSSRPDAVWPTAAELDVEAALAPYAEAPSPVRQAVRTAALLHSSMSLPVAMRTAAVELAAFLQPGEGTP